MIYGEADITGDREGRHYFDDSNVPILEPQSTPIVGDTVFYLGEVRDDDAINLWRPVRVVWTELVGHRWAHVRSVVDSELVDRYIGEVAVPLRLLSPEERSITRELAETLEPATAQQSQILLAIFGCK